MKGDAKMKLIEININQKVRVKLSKEALERKQKEVEKFNKKFNESVELPIDSEGYYKDQLWCIMRDFGDMIQGCYSPISDFKMLIEIADM